MKFLMSALLALQFASGTSNIQSKAHDQPRGAHGVRNEQFGLFLRPRDASDRDGEPIVLYTQQPWKCMAWRFDDVDGSTRLVNFFTHKSFAVQQSSPDKALVQITLSSDHRQSEAFNFVALAGGSYEIASDSGEALTAVDVNQHGDIRVVVSPWKNLASQRWQLVNIPDHFTM
jgi:hypothetical protein